ncbi:hypothetical protein ACTMTJ_12950 [Phytohabitans sp. LJ34]|uniref:hypothetical protein n=1 Tax=Phytohabitans sp. LJ34 TaxID=3452217 RepID=UPI003F8867C7
MALLSAAARIEPSAATAANPAAATVPAASSAPTSAPLSRNPMNSPNRTTRASNVSP